MALESILRLTRNREKRFFTKNKGLRRTSRCFSNQIRPLKSFILAFYMNCCLLSGKNDRKKCYDPNCGGSLHAHLQTHTLASGEKATHFYYTCARPLMKNGRCSGCSIPIDILDSAVAEYIIEVIRDPSVVDRKMQELQARNPASKQQQNKLKNLNVILREQETFRINLAAELRKKTFSERTAAFLNTQLAALELQEQEARRELADQQRVQQQQENLERRIAEFHQQCQEWREKLDDPQFTPDFKFNREAVIFFGITVIVWRVGTKPRYEIYTDPPEIVQLLS